MQQRNQKKLSLWDSGPELNIKKKNKYLTLKDDLERQSQTHFFMTFLICGYIHDTDLILVSNITNSRSVILNKP